MGKPVAGRNKFPFGVYGITVAGVAHKNGTTETNIKISKQRSINVFDLLSVDGKTIFTYLDLTAEDKDGKPLDMNKSDDELVQVIKPGSFFLRAMDHKGENKGFVIRIMSNKVTLQDGESLYDWDMTAEFKIKLTGISLNKTTLALLIGGSESLLVTYAPPNATEKGITWTSSAPTIASVDSTGKVIGVLAGSANIVAKATDGGFTTTCAVSITAPVVNVTGVTLNKSTTTINVGATETLTATVAPTNATNKAVTWTSSNTSFATVDGNGKVTAVATGSATITATTTDGAKTATCTVTVPAVVPTGVTLDKKTAAGAVGDADVQLTATVAPANTTDKTLTWTTSDPLVATVSSTGLVKFIGTGTATITVKTTSGAKTDTCVVTVS